MKNVRRSLRQYFISSALLIFAFGPTFGFGMFAQPPLYSDRAESSEDQAQIRADKTVPANRPANEKSAPQKFAAGAMPGDADAKENLPSGSR